MGASWADCKSKKSSFWSILSYFMQQWTISPSDCDMQQKVDFNQQLAMTSSVVGLRRSSKALPKAKIAPKIGHSHCLVVCCPSDPLQLSESQQNHYIWEVCRTNQWDALKAEHLQPALVNRKGSILLHDNAQLHIAQSVLRKFKNWTLKFCLIAIFTWPHHQLITASSSI